MANKNQIIIYSAVGIGAVGILYLMMQSGAKTTTPPSVNAAAAAAQLKANQQAGANTGITGLVSSLGTLLGIKPKPVAPTVAQSAVIKAAAATVPKTTVDSVGDYIEIADPTTLYDINGNVIGSLDDSIGMFVSANNAVIASSDGTPVMSYDFTTGNYQESSGLWYNSGGTEITAPTS